MNAGSQNPAEFVTSDNQRIPVHFNPASLQFTLTNTLERKGSKPQQFVKESKAALSMELVFDTTQDNTNVCVKTEQIAKLMEPGKDKVPPVVTFDWGDFTFRGIVDSYKETIDFFSAGGIPLRCTVQLSMSRQDKVFDSRSEGGAGGGSGGGAGGAGGGGGAGGSSGRSGGTGGAPGDIVDTTPQTDQSTTSVASQGGDPDAGRAIAESNGEESIRFPQNASLSINTSVSLGPPVAFASGGAGFSTSAGFSAGVGAGAGIGISGGAGIGISGGAGIGISGGAGIGISGGAGIGISGGAGIGISGGAGIGIGAGASAGTGISAGAGIGVSVDLTASGSFGTGVSVSGSAGVVSGPIAGGSASAGVPASQGAFIFLRAPSLPERPARLDGRRYTHRTETQGYATGGRAAFQLGGMATADSATVDGDTTTLRGRIRFGET